VNKNNDSQENLDLLMKKILEFGKISKIFRTKKNQITYLSSHVNSVSLLEKGRKKNIANFRKMSKSLDESYNIISRNEDFIFDSDRYREDFNILEQKMFSNAYKVFLNGNELRFYVKKGGVKEFYLETDSPRFHVIKHNGGHTFKSYSASLESDNEYFRKLIVFDSERIKFDFPDLDRYISEEQICNHLCDWFKKNCLDSDWFLFDPNNPPL
jgi:hypothetical protein